VNNNKHIVNQVSIVNLHRKTAANRYAHQTGQSVLGPGFKLGTSRIGSRKAIQSTGKCG